MGNSNRTRRRRNPPEEKPNFQPEYSLENIQVFEYGEVIDKNRPPQLVHPDYKLYTDNDFYYTFLDRKLKKFALDWKIHLSIREEVPNVADAWNNVVWPLIKKYHLKEVKVVRPEALRRDCSDGKVVTIYLAYNPEFREDHMEHFKLRLFLQEIEEGLVARNIIPGSIPRIDRKIKGSQFIYYRCERGKLIDEVDQVYNYVTDEKAESRVKKGKALFANNPYSYPDTYGLCKIDFSSQLDHEAETSQEIVSVRNTY